MQNAKENLLGEKNDGNLMEVYPNGDVFWSQRIRAVINCHFHLARLPWDMQTCEVDVGLFSQTVQEVNMTWTDNNNEGALANLEKQVNSQWFVGKQRVENRLHKGAAGDYTIAVAEFTLTRCADTSWVCSEYVFGCVDTTFPCSNNQLAQVKTASPD